MTRFHASVHSRRACHHRPCVTFLLPDCRESVPLLSCPALLFSEALHLDRKGGSALSLRAGQGAVVVSALLVGAIFGSLGAGPAADALGPRRALLLNNVFFVAGSLLGAATPGGYWGAIAGARPPWAWLGGCTKALSVDLLGGARGLCRCSSRPGPASGCMQRAALPGKRRS